MRVAAEVPPVVACAASVMIPCSGSSGDHPQPMGTCRQDSSRSSSAIQSGCHGDAPSGIPSTTMGREPEITRPGPLLLTLHLPPRRSLAVGTATGPVVGQRGVRSRVPPEIRSVPGDGVVRIAAKAAGLEPSRQRRPRPNTRPTASPKISATIPTAPENRQSRGSGVSSARHSGGRPRTRHDTDERCACAPPGRTPARPSRPCPNGPCPACRHPKRIPERRYRLDFPLFRR